MLQAIVAGILVVMAVAYAGWQLMPQSWRRSVLTALLAHLQKPWQEPLARRIRLASASPGGCGACGGGASCSPVPGKTGTKAQNPVAAGDNTKPLVFHPRRRNS